MAGGVLGNAGPAKASMQHPSRPGMQPVDAGVARHSFWRSGDAEFLLCRRGGVVSAELSVYEVPPALGPNQAVRRSAKIGMSCSAQFTTDPLGVRM